MSNGFVLVLLRQLREGMEKFQQESHGRMDDTGQRLNQMIGSLDRVENDLNELKKHMRQHALNQAKHEEQHSQSLENVDKELRGLKEQIHTLKSTR